ncbi:MAG: cytochrome c-type biogenesis protein CcmH [Acidimicrobiales bacterium]|nr:cytochrome c-type biogenesis protein CcmH [Acidimicrobiales bacterium]
MRRFAPGSVEAWVFIVVSLVALISVASFAGGGAVNDGERAEILNDQFACPTCDGQSVAESNAAVAATIRQFIRDEVAAGSSDTEIRDALVQSYGTEVLLNPPSSGVATLVWVLPVVVLAGGAGIVIASLTRGRTVAAPTAADERLVAELRRERD